MADIIIYVVKEQRKWRNWQTRRTKDPVIALDREGSSPSFRRVTSQRVLVFFYAQKSLSENRNESSEKV
jgi:hypothetical protein